MTRRDDPLNDILLPAEDIARRSTNGDRQARTQAERKLVAAVLVLIAERDATRWLYRETLDRAEAAETAIEAWEAEADAATRDRVRGLLRLRNRTGVVK